MRVLFINTPARQCGVHSFGETTAEILATSTKLQLIRIHLPENTQVHEYLQLLQEHQPDFVLYNYHPATMSWLEGGALILAHARFPQLKHVSIAHDWAPQLPHLVAAIHLDPSFEETHREFRVGRLVLDFSPTQKAPANVIGSFGYAGHHKNFPKVVDLVNAEFDEATVRIHMPAGHYGDPHAELARQIGEECRKRAKLGIKVEVTHDYKSSQQLIEWLSGNTVNCFLYDPMEGHGISSAIDFSLAAQRPIAVSDSQMFRHLIKKCPGVRVQERSLKAIIADGFAPLDELRRSWSAENLRKDYERIFETIQRRPTYNLTSNRELTPEDREALKPVVEELRKLEPDIMSRKIPEAVFQNAFVFQQVKEIARKNDEIILIGGFEDPIGPALKKLGYKVRITDPAIDGKNAKDVWFESIEKTGTRYDIVVSCSVIEHVSDDDTFIFYLYSLLKPGGTAILTTDYNDDWREGMHKPDSDVRIYNAARMRYLASLLPAESLLDPPTWKPMEPYFEIVGARYGFCSLAFWRPLRVPEVAMGGMIFDDIDRAIRELSVTHRHLASENKRFIAHIEYLNGLLARAGADFTASNANWLHHTEHLEKEIASLQAEVARFGNLRNAGPFTIKLANQLSRIVSFFKKIFFLR